MGVVCSSLRGTRSGGHRYPKLGWPLVPRPLGVEILVLCASDPISARPAGAAWVWRGPDGASCRLRRRGRLSGVVKAAAGTRLPGQGPWGRVRQSQGIPTSLHGPCAVAGPPALASRAGCARAHCARAHGGGALVRSPAVPGEWSALSGPQCLGFWYLVPLCL